MKGRAAAAAAALTALLVSGCGESRECVEWETHYITKHVTVNKKPTTRRVPVRTCERYEESKGTHAP